LQQLSPRQLFEGPPDPSKFDVLCIMRPVLRYTNHVRAAADAKMWQSFVEGRA
jgi:hypothetical protein